MNHRIFGALDCLKGSADNMLSGLCQHLNRDIIRNQIFIDQLSQKFKFRLACCRKADFNFLEANLDKQLEKLDFFIQTHRYDQCLIAIPQIHTAPLRCFFYILFFCPVHTRLWW